MKGLPSSSNKRLINSLADPDAMGHGKRPSWALRRRIPRATAEASVKPLTGSVSLRTFCARSWSILSCSSSISSSAFALNL
jgi:hypothetical protein